MTDATRTFARVLVDQTEPAELDLLHEPQLTPLPMRLDHARVPFGGLIQRDSKCQAMRAFEVPKPG